MFYEKTTLDNGTTILSEHMDGVRSVALGLWVRTGSRDERPQTAGMSHFMEHMVFKGTPTRSALDISMAFDALGAELNAFTSREYTCFYARVMDEHLADAFEILSDMVVNASFTQETIDTEREVVIEEIARSEDTPEDHVYDVFADALLPTHPLGRPVLGTRDIVGAFQTEDLRAYHDEHYTTGNLTVVASGNIDHEQLVELSERWLEGMKAGERLVRREHEETDRKQLLTVTKKTEQAHLLYGMPSISLDSPKRFAYGLLDAALGGGMSSRLFQEIREKRGLVYAVYTSSQLFEGLGAFMTYAGTRPENIEQIFDVTRTEFEKMVQEGITQEELDRVRELVCGNFVLALESTRTHMMRLGRLAVTGMELRSIDETLADYRAVTVDDISQAAGELLTQEPTIAVVSPYSREQIEEMI